jgi:hypothetical protein
MRVRAFSVSLIVFMAIASRPEGAQGGRNYGAGAETCGKWTQARKGDGWFTSGQWMLGWVSAAQYYGRTLKPTDSAGMAGWVDQYCSQHPLNTLAEASVALVEELTAKQ